MNLSTEEIHNRIDKAKNLDDFWEILAEIPDMTFSKRIFELCEDRGLNFSQVQVASGITKSLFYGIANGTKTPKKHHIIKIGVAMRLTIEEINELLKLARQKELYGKNREDAVIIFGLKKNLSTEQIESLLEEVGAAFSLYEK